MALAFALTLSPVSPARGYVAVEPLREVLHGSAPALRSCQRTFSLPDGHYHVRFEIDALGKIANYRLAESPTRLSAGAYSCIEAAFSHLRFPARGTRPDARTRARPPGQPPLRGTRRRVGGFGVVWLFVLRSEAAPRPATR
ncbi:MAG: hypothetical protein GXP55_05350 [Deltaproteobacteria bacterium]|nr:hypothetical protein [Deltaproteobacteria bacterium]